MTDETQDVILAELKRVNESILALRNDISDLRAVVDTFIMAISHLPYAVKTLLKPEDDH